MRRFFYVGYFSLLWVLYLAVYFLIPSKDILTYISLLFCTIALTALLFLPVIYPKYQSRHWIRFKLYLVLIPYAATVFAYSYLFTFQFRMNPDFYFLVHTLIMLATSILLLVATHIKKIEQDEEEQEETIKTFLTSLESEEE